MSAIWLGVVVVDCVKVPGLAVGVGGHSAGNYPHVGQRHGYPSSPIALESCGVFARSVRDLPPRPFFRFFFFFFGFVSSC